MEEITISMEEYKELLITKGKYEELKTQQISKPSHIDYPSLTRAVQKYTYPINKEEV